MKEKKEIYNERKSDEIKNTKQKEMKKNSLGWLYVRHVFRSFDFSSKYNNIRFIAHSQP